MNKSDSHNHHNEDDDHSEHHHHHPKDTNSNGCESTIGKNKCSILHEHTCHDGHHDDTEKPFKEQFDLWFRGLIDHNRADSELNASDHEHHHDHRSENETHIHRHHHHRHGETPIGAHDHVAKRDDSFADDMEESVRGPEMIYATCELIPNRHISLILQENVEGRVNMWQQKDGQAPLFTHVKLSGLRVPGEFKSRVVRESNLMPIETPYNSSSISLMERGFHVHVNGDLSRDCQSTGPHFNPTDSTHGGPVDEIRHIGDLGNIRSNERGSIDTEYTYPKVSLVGEHSIIGRSLVVSILLDVDIIYSCGDFHE